MKLNFLGSKMLMSLETALASSFSFTPVNLTLFALPMTYVKMCSVSAQGGHPCSGSTITG